MYVYKSFTPLLKSAEEIKQMVKVQYCEEGMNGRDAQLQSFAHFADFLDECEGICVLSVHNAKNLNMATQLI